MKTDTIAAAATAVPPMGGAGIGVVRISGEDAILVADRVFFAGSGKHLADQESHTAHYGHIRDEEGVIDEVIVLLMRAPRTYTREDTVEIDCHGGAFVMRRILETVIRNGARPAEPGEFTKRAFLNGRIDLSQAESVLDVIQAQNEFALKNSVRQLSGSVSSEVRRVRGEILHQIAYIESALDDPEHISLDGYPCRLKEIVSEQVRDIQKLLKNSDDGRILKEGISTVIAGKPNAGKSSLLNWLVGEERAIVTEIPGTTRDVLEEQISLDGIVLRLTDTAGIRSTEDPVEKIGVDRAKKFLTDADLVFYVVDSSTNFDESDAGIIELLPGKKTIIIFNKSDLTARTTPQEVKSLIGKENENCRFVTVSAKEQTGKEELCEAVREMFFAGKIFQNDQVYITNIRHKAALLDTLASLELVKQSIDGGMPEDFYSIDLMNAYEELGKITGEAVEDDLVNEIFSKFCMGK